MSFLHKVLLDVSKGWGPLCLKEGKFPGQENPSKVPLPPLLHLQYSNKGILLPLTTTCRVDLISQGIGQVLDIQGKRNLLKLCALLGHSYVSPYFL